MTDLFVNTDFPPEDFAWLTAESRRRGLEIFQFINVLIETYLPNGFRIDRPMTEAEASKAFAEQLLNLVHKVRLGTV